MSDVVGRFTCPRCRATLRVMSREVARLTCPRCLAPFANPLSPVAPAEPAVAASPPGTRCWACAESLPEGQHRFCPHCGESLDRARRRPPRRAAEFERDLRRDAAWTNGGLILLSGFGLLGVGWLLLSTEIGEQPIAWLLAVVALSILGLGIYLRAGRADETSRKAGDAILSGLAATGALVGGVFVAGLLLVLALLVFLTVVCKGL